MNDVIFKMNEHPVLKLRDRILEAQRPAFIMGILNADDDSFWKESRGNQELGFSLIGEGADIIDIGGESTRPGSAYVSAEEEIRRVIPVIREIRKRSSVPISVDTRKKAVMEAALNEGADILNDVSALEDDPEMGRFAADAGIPVILMHKRGNPDIMQQDGSYADVFSEVNDYLEARAAYAISCGISPEKIIVDPGIGFGKDLDANRILIKKAGLLCGGKYPVLMALSRKSCIGQMTGREVQDRLYGTLAADLYSVMCGASMIRVHDVAAAVDTLNVLKGVVYAGD